MPFFAAIDTARLRAHQRAFIAAAIGGPDTYAGRDMQAAHAGMGITDADFEAVVVVGHLVATLASLGVPLEAIEPIGGTLLPLRPGIVTVP